MENNKKELNGLTSKRSNYLEWQEYFMSIAFLSAQRSKDPRTQVGACIVNSDNKVVGIGYNGMPIGCSDDLMPWNRATDDTKEKWLESKSPYVCHAELNAVLNKNLADIRGCKIYVALFPCNMCAQIIIQSGIKEVIYYSDKYHGRPEFKASRRLMDTAGVKYWQFRPRQKRVIIDFELIEATAGEIPTLPTVTNCSDKNGSCDTEVTTNNNNTGVPKQNHLENHAEQQQLQQINQQVQPQLPGQQQQTQWLQVPFSPAQRHEAIEINFAVVSFLFIAFIAFFSWYLAHAKLVVIVR